MIRIHKPKAPPAILKNRGSKATQALCEAFERGETEFEFDSGIYGATSVKNALKIAQHDKCAFCESRFSHVAYGDVEHFRPKGGHQQRGKDALERPGYYWLAYEWSNLFFSCQFCNQRHKKNLFPLADPTQRARSHRHRLDDENPLLIDGGSEDPETFIGFREEYAFPIDGNPRGEATIDILGINREEMVEFRRGHLASLERLKRLVEMLEEEIRRSGGAGDPVLKEIQEELNVYRTELRNLVGTEAPYSSMSRAALNVSPGSPRKRRKPKGR